LPDPRGAKDLAESEAERQKQEQAANLPPEQRQKVLKEIEGCANTVSRMRWTDGSKR
jgi:hypothetical protein